MNDRVLVTGATAGIGRETARQLARQGARVIVHGRDWRKVDAVLAELEGDEHEGALADFTSFNDVRALADHIAEQFGRLDVLVNNAGIFPTERLVTENKQELTFQVNHLSPFLLTNLLVPFLKAGAPARVVTVCSAAHAKGALDFHNLGHEKDFQSFQAYADSKLANVMFGYALARRLEGSGVTSVCMDPGATNTQMLKIAHPDYAGRSVKDAAEELTALCLSVAHERSNATYFREGSSHRPSSASQDESTQEHLWKISARRVGLRRW